MQEHFNAITSLLWFCLERKNKINIINYKYKYKYYNFFLHLHLGILFF